MTDLKGRSPFFKKSYLQTAGILLLLLLALFLLWFNKANNRQSLTAMMAQVRFEGEYRIGEGEWQVIDPAQHIPATRGDVTLRGDFHLYTPDGEYIGIYRDQLPIAFYSDHINISVVEDENDPFVFDIENPLFGSSACGVYWDGYVLSNPNVGEIEIRIHNPHRFGNDNAVDEMLDNMALWSGIEFEKEIMTRDQGHRNSGMFFIIVALVLLGSALFSALLHIRSNRIIWQIGAAILSAGLCLAYSGQGISFWKGLISGNTTILGCAMMFYMLFLSCIIAGSFRESGKIGRRAVTVLGITIGIFLLLPMVGDIRFYDTWLPWVVVQSAVNMVLLGCMVKEFAARSSKGRWGLVGISLPIYAFEIDAFATAMAWWEGALISKYVFFILFVAALIVVLRIIPEGINAATKARELEAEKNMALAELKESRVAIMLSQIKPHFIYNTLGTIERMCLKDPQKAFDLVRNFSLYLRGNFSELDSVAPIRFSKELEHVEYYVNIEKVRFPDMDIRYEVEATDFVLPALSVQPLVENAIKHGLMRLESGGTVVIHSYETESHFCVEVRDDGAGFDVDAPIDTKKHVGLRNIRGRLKAMVNGELILESRAGVGTRALIRIPKEVTL